MTRGLRLPPLSRFLFLAAALVALAVLIVGDGAPPAQAQSAVELVTNKGQSSSALNHDWSDAFGLIIFTGAGNAGKTYTLTKIRVLQGSAMTNPAAFRTELWSASNTEFVPVEKITDLTITPIDGVSAVDLVAPEGTTLAGNDRYALVVYRLAGFSTATWSYSATVSASETSSLGWRLGNNRKAASSPPTSSSTWGDPGDTVFVRIPKITVFGFEGVLPTVTLTSDDADGEIAESAGSVTLTATLSEAAPSGGVSVTLSTASGTATATDDYSLSSATITIAQGDTTGTTILNIVDDATTEGDETLVLKAAASGHTSGSLSLTIKDNEPALSGLTAESSTDGSNFTAMTGAATLAPAFDAAATGYRATVGNGVTHVRLTPTLADTGSSMQVGKAGSLATVASGNASAAIPLDVDDNEITVRVTDTNGNTQDYTVTVRRVPTGSQWWATLTPSGTTNIGCTSSANCDSLLTDNAFTYSSTNYKFTRIVSTSTGGSVQINRNSAGGLYSDSLNFCVGGRAFPFALGATTLLGGSSLGWTAGVPVSLSVGASCVQQVKPTELASLTAESSADGSNFTGLSLAPAFGRRHHDYRATVGNDTTHVRLTPTVAVTGSTVEVGKSGGTLTTVVSGSPSDAIPLDVGDNEITVRVTDTNGNTQDYTVTVRRAASDQLVSNLGQFALAFLDTNGTVYASGFTTGSNAAGYTLSSIEAYLKADPTAAQSGKFRAELWSADTNGGPGAKQADLDVPSDMPSGVVSFAAPASTRLRAGTEYYAVFYTTDGTTIQLEDTDATHEDAAAAAGWSIENTGYYQKRQSPDDTQAWTSYSASNGLIKIGVRGAERQFDSVDLRALTAESSADGSNFTALILGPDFDHETTRYYATVDNDATHVRLTPTLADTTASLTLGKGVSPTPVTSGSASDPIALDVGVNLIWIAVQASYTQEYLVYVRRASPDLLVSNAGQPPEFVGTTTESSSIAQAFTTGSEARGYTLESIEAFLGASATETERDTIRAELWSADTNGAPYSKLADLTVPAHPIAPSTTHAGAPASVIFTPPASTTLAASTIYYAVFYTAGSLDLALTRTNSDSEDAGGAAGWSIADGFRNVEDDEPTSSSAWSSEQDAPLRITVNAPAEDAPVALSGLTMESSTDGITFTAVTGAAVVAPAFDAATTGYRATVGNDVTHVRLTATEANGGRVYIGSGSLFGYDSGSPSDPIALRVGDNDIGVAGARLGTPDYTITVRRVPTGSQWWATLTPSGTTNIGCTSSANCDSLLTDNAFTYSATNYKFTRIVSTSTGGSVQINRNSAGGLYSDSLNFCVGERAFPFALGATTLLGGSSLGWTAGVPVSLSVGATCAKQAAPTDLAALTVAGSADGSNFAALTGAATLAPAFYADTMVYRATVGNDTTQVRLTPTAAVTGSTVEVGKSGGTLSTVVSGSASDAIALDVGDNEITVRVTDTNSNTQDYTVTVRRVPTGSQWWATMTPKSNIGGVSGYAGCHATNPASAHCDTNLTEDDFTVGGTSYEFLQVYTGPAEMIMLLSAAPTSALQQLKFCAGPVGYSIASTQQTRHTSNLPTWAEGTPVSLSIGTSCAQQTLSANTNLSNLTASSATSATGTYTTLALTPATFNAATTSYTATVVNTISHVKLTPTVDDTGKATVAAGKQGATLTAVTDTQASAAIELVVGSNAITVRVTAEDSTTKDYTVTITRQGQQTLSANANLSNLTASSATSATGTYTTLALTPATFNAATTSYTATVVNTISHVKLTPTVDDTRKATVAVGKQGATLTAVTDTQASAAIALVVGSNAITVRVTAEDSTTKDYTVTITRQGQQTLSANANLSNLTASSATSATGTYTTLALTPATFNAATTSYTATVVNTISHVKLTPTVDDTGKATVAVGKQGATLTAVTDTQASAAIALAVGDNAITVRVTAEDSTTKDYTVTITQQSATPQAPTVSLSASPNPVNEGSSVTITATLSKTVTSNVTIPMTLTAGSAESGDYGTLASITVASGQTTGTGTISTNHDSGENDETFTVAVDTANLPSSVQAGSPSSVVVTITDDDKPSTNADLSALTASSSTSSSGSYTALALAPAFSSATTSYAATVESAVTHARLTPTVEDTGKATVQVGKSGSLVTVSSGRASAAIGLDDGANAIIVRVAAEDGNTTRDYTVTITRAPRPTVSLSASPNPVRPQHDPNDPDVKKNTVTITATLSRPFPEVLWIPVTLDQDASNPDHSTISVIGISANSLTGTHVMNVREDRDTQDDTFTVALDTAKLPREVAAGSPASVTVIIQDTDNPAAPGALPNFKVTPKVRYLELTWKKPATRTTHYEVQFKTAAAPNQAGSDGDPTTGWISLPRYANEDATTRRITRLTAGTTYDVRARAMNDQAAGPWATGQGTPKGSEESRRSGGTEGATVVEGRPQTLPEDESSKERRPEQPEQGPSAGNEGGSGDPPANQEPERREEQQPASGEPNGSDGGGGETIAERRVAPLGALAFNADRAAPGATITLTGAGFVGYAPLQSVLIAGVEVFPGGRVITDAQGRFTVELLVPGVGRGRQEVVATVGGQTASGFLVIDPSAVADTTTPVARAWAGLADRDLVVAHHDNEGKRWRFYYPRVPARPTWCGLMRPRRPCSTDGNGA